MPSCRPTRPDFRAVLRAPRKIPLVMGIVNATPDSFYAASRASSCEEAVRLGLELASEGADILDVGGQSTRPGSDPVDEAEEIRRVVWVVEALAAKTALPISIDTDKAEVARLALEAGASVINDVSALRSDPRMVLEAQKADGVILMHRGGDSPKTMQEAPSYRDVVSEVRTFLEGRLAAFAAAGGDADKVLLDPGIGFGKTLDHNLTLLKHLDAFTAMKNPVVLGVSRKSFLGGVGPSERLEGSLAVACLAQQKGVAVLRVHDVKATKRALEAAAAVMAAR